MNDMSVAETSRLRRIAPLVLAGVALACSGAVTASSITVQSGGITLNSTDTTTAGTAADPWIIDEDMTATGTLQLASSPLGSGNSTGTFHTSGKWFSKTVFNDSADPWTSFELELQVLLGTPSPDGDGLSFAQGGSLSFTSDVFSTYTRIDDTRDYLNFHDGSVAVGGSVTFKFAITDNSVHDPIYLLQTPNKADVPEPGTLALLGIAGAGLVARRRRRAG